MEPLNQCTKCGKNDAPDSLKLCSKCKNMKYCSKECQIADWKTHKLKCFAPLPDGPNPIRGIVIPCDAEQRRYGGIFKAVDLDATHPIHSKGIVCPVSSKVGLPIIIYCHLWDDPLRSRGDAGLDNPKATFLMIDPESGFAPPEWQQCVGSVTVMRKDNKPLTEEAIETIWMYHDHLLDLFGNDRATPRKQMTKKGFENYCRSYKKQRGFRNMPVPL